MKKVFSLFLSFIFLITLVLGNVDVTYASSSETRHVYDSDNNHIIVNTNYETGTQIEIPIYIAYDKKTNRSYQVSEDVAKKKISSSLLPDALVSYNVVINTNNGILTYGYRITAIIGTKPSSATITVAPQVSTTRNGVFSQWGSRTFNLSSNDFGLNKTQTTTDNMFYTNYWRFKISGNTYYTGGTSHSVNVNSDYTLLFNKKGIEYPTYSDPQSGIKLIEPRTDLPVNQRQAGSNYRSNFITTYENTYGTPTKFNWSNVQIHHMIPLKYNGGDNFSNLIPLWNPGSQAQNGIINHSILTTWWTNY